MEESKATNLSQIKRRKMLETLKKIKQNISDEETLNNLSLIENELNEKKYGLVWEEHEERVDKELKTQIPVFENVTDKEIVSDEKLKYNFLLEGDNLHSLYLLEKTHKGKIDVILIDPPYNTDNRDFIYNDSCVNPDDEFRHSKWLSFMAKRLEIAKNLLSKTGLIFIHIDDNEQAPLKLLCDSIFGEENFVNCIAVKMSEPTGVKMSHYDKRLPKLKEYVLLYKKSSIHLKNIQINKDKWDSEYKTFLDGVEKSEVERLKEIRDKKEHSQEEMDELDSILSKMHCVPILQKYKELGLKTNAQKEEFNFENAWRIAQIVSMSGGAKQIADKKRSKVGDSELYSIVTPRDKVYIIKNGYDSEIDIPRIKVLFADDYLTVNPCDFWQDIKTTGLDNEGFVDFKNGKKPLKVEKRIIELSNNPMATVLDFFAGSGTTAQAVIEQNLEDGGNRKFILCTNDDNNICSTITYKRLSAVNKNIGKFNLKYYRCQYVPRIDTEEENLHNNLLTNIKNLIQLENGINIDDKSIKVFLGEEEFDKMTADKDALDECDKVYISSDILMTSEQEKILENNNIDVFAITEYYFKDEIVEVTE